MCNGIRTQADDPRIRIAGDLDLAFRFARVVCREEIFPPVFDPFHRPPGTARRKGNKKILGIKLSAHAKAAANIILDHQDLFFGQIKQGGQCGAVVKRHLGCTEDLHPTRLAVPFGQKPPRFHRHRGVAVYLEALLAGIGRARECGVDVAANASDGRW